MKRIVLAAVLLLALLVPAQAVAKARAASLVSCEYSVYGGMENEDYTYTIRRDDAPDFVMLTLAERDGLEAYSLPAEALDDLADFMSAYDPAGWSTLPEREIFALDAPTRCIELTYDDGSEYTLTSDRDAGGPIFGDTGRIFERYVSGEFDVDSDMRPGQAAAMSRLAGIYKYENEGFGGDFTITLNADGTYAFYEGMLSSYMGGGSWRVRDGAVRMTEENGLELHFEFGIGGGALIYRAAGSSAFPYVQVADAERFVRQDAAEEN